MFQVSRDTLYFTYVTIFRLRQNILQPAQNNGKRMRLTFYEDYEVWSEFSVLLESTTRDIFSFLYEAHFENRFSTGTKEFYAVRGARAVFTDVSLARI